MTLAEQKPKKKISRGQGLDRLELTMVKPAANLKKIGVDTNEETFYLSCLTGGNTAANIAIEQCEILRQIWGEGSDFQAKSLVKMFSLVMLSQWLYQLRTESSLDQKREKAYRNSAWTLLSLFEQDPQAPLFPVLMDQQIDIAIKLDAQFKHEIENEDDMASYAILLLSWAAQAVGETVLDWHKVHIPLTDFARLSESQAILNNKPFKKAQNLTTILNAHQHGVISMARFYSQMKPAQKEAAALTKTTAKEVKATNKPTSIKKTKDA